MRGKFKMNNYDNLITSADAIGLFCRLHMNTKMDIPIRPSQMGVLIFIHRSETLVSPLMISEFFKITKPSVTSMINALEKEGYIIKKSCLEDGRSYSLTLNKEGKTLVNSTFKEYLKFVELLQKKMGETNFNEFIRLMVMANSVLHEEGKQ